VKSKPLHFALVVILVFVANLTNLTMAQAVGDALANKSSTAPSPADEPVTTMSVQVKVVNVFATARDKHGKIVNGLNKDNFTLTEDGRPQVIRYFARETDIPLTLGLLVDTSMSQRRVLGEEQSASQSFLNEMVRVDEDKAFVIHFDRDVELLQDLTSSHEKLETALQSLATPQLTRTSEATRRAEAEARTRTPGVDQAGAPAATRAEARPYMTPSIWHLTS
jgi:VWFA-related protein